MSTVRFIKALGAKIGHAPVAGVAFAATAISATIFLDNEDQLSTTDFPIFERISRQACKLLIDSEMSESVGINFK